MSKHTPGPWVWDGNTLKPAQPDPERSAVHSILDAEGGYGFLGSKVSATMAELDADRQLISAAPELLAVAQIVANLGEYRELVDAMAAVLRSHERAGFVKLFRQDAPAAVAKAIGSASV